jgi:hypothetical protein
MTKHTMYATAHGNVPSNTSRYASTDIGLLHMVGLDLNKIDDAQLAWLEADLQAVNKNRERTPWIMVMSHFPIYHSVRAAQGRLSGISISHRKSILYGACSFCMGLLHGRANRLTAENGGFGPGQKIEGEFNGAGPIAHLGPTLVACIRSPIQRPNLGPGFRLAL